MAYKGPADYNDVASRIVEFRTIHPEGSLRPLNPKKPFEVVTIGDKTFIVYAAAAYRTPDDAKPGVGIAWEPFPGKTNFTRDSEVMVAETSAWGRAMIAALAVDAKKGIASAEEVMNRQQGPVERPVEPVPAEVVADWVSAFDEADSLPALQTAWEEAGVAGVTRDPDIIAAKDRKKASL